MVEPTTLSRVDQQCINLHKSRGQFGIVQELHILGTVLYSIVSSVYDVNLPCLSVPPKTCQEPSQSAVAKLLFLYLKNEYCFQSLDAVVGLRQINIINLS